MERKHHHTKVTIIRRARFLAAGFWLIAAAWAQTIAVSVTISTTTLPAGQTGQPYSQTLTASGGSNGYTWTLASGTLPGGLTLSGTGVISGTPIAAGAFNFTVNVSSGGSSATKDLTITIGAPLTIATASLPDASTGTVYQQTLTASGGSGTYSWALSAGALPAGLSLSAAGVISGTPLTVGSSSFTVQVTDGSSAKATKAFSIAVVTGALTVTTTSLPAGIAGTAYQASLTAAGGAGGYSWSLTSGALPGGLLLSFAGTISGTPNATGSFDFTVQVTDNSGAKATKALSIAIVGSKLTITTLSLPTGLVGAPYQQTLAVTGGAGVFTWSLSSGSLPAGLTLSVAGVISGTPLAVATSNFSVQVSDTSGSKATQALSIAITGPSIAITTSSLPSDTVGSPYQQTLTATGGSGAYTWIVSSGSLPAGLSLSASGAISGTPITAGTSTFTVQVSDAIGDKATQTYNVVIAAARVVITTQSLTAATVGSSYSVTLQASGGQSPYSWLVTGGALPAGLSLSSAGVLSGTPGAAGSFNFTVQVSDAAASTATASYSLTVGAASIPAITISGFSGTVQSLQQPTVDIALAQPFAAAITGTVSLTFTPGGANPADDPAIQFASGGRTATFTIAANATHATVGGAALAVQTGSVAGSITLAVQTLQAGGATIPVPAGLSQTAQVNTATPIINTISVVHTSGGLQVQLTGVANTRELTQATVTFTPAAGTSVQTTQLTVPLTALSDTWFRGGTASPYGGQFSLTLPFTFNGTVTLSSVSTVLSNSAGSSTAASANY